MRHLITESTDSDRYTPTHDDWLEWENYLDMCEERELHRKIDALNLELIAVDPSGEAYYQKNLELLTVPPYCVGI